jgi:hypothetical protein
MQLATIKPVPGFPDSLNALGTDAFSWNGVANPTYRWLLGRMEKTPDDKGESFTPTQIGNGAFTEEQWAKWTVQGDDYLIEIAAQNLGVEIVTVIGDDKTP